MGSRRILLCLLVATLVGQSTQTQTILDTYNPDGQNLPEWVIKEGADYNPGPPCPDNPYCKGVPWLNCLNWHKPCGRWQNPTKRKMVCCYSRDEGRGMICRMPNRWPAKEYYGESHRTYCLPIRDKYDSRMSGVPPAPPQSSLVNDEIIEQLARIADAVEG